MARKNQKNKKGNSDLQGPSTPKININEELRKVQRLIFLTDLTPCYVSGDPELHFLKDFALHLPFITDILTNIENTEKFVEILKKANNDGNLPRRVTLFYVLAYALRNSHDNKITNLLAVLVLEICKTDEELFRFLKIFVMMKGKERDLKKEEPYNKITTSLSKVIRKFLENKSTIEYAKAVCRTKGYYGWQYKDLIKLSHYKSETAEKLLITEYVLFGLKGVKEPETEDLKSIYKLLQDWNDLGKAETGVEKICKMIEELKPDYRRIHPKHIKQQEVWGAIIPYLPAEEVMKLLPKWHRYNLLQPTETSIVYGKVMDALTPAKVRCQNVNPLATFIHLKNFQKGGKGIDPKLLEHLNNKKVEVKVSPPISASNPIAKLLYKNIHNADPTSFGLHKKILLVIDVTDTDTACFKQRNISCLEAQVALAMYYAKTEKNLEIVVIDGDEINKFDLDKSSYDKNLNKLKEMKSKPPNPAEVFNWALKNTKKFDVFLLIMQSPKSLSLKDSRTSMRDSFKEYQTKNSDLQSKLVLICLGLHNLAGFGETLNALAIAGFCPEIPKVIRAYVKGNIHPLKIKPKKKN